MRDEMTPEKFKRMYESEFKPDEITVQLADCLQRKEKLTDWETQFVTDLSIRYRAGRISTLSVKQSARLDEIWEKVTSHGGITLRKLETRDQMLAKQIEDIGKLKIK